MNARDGGGLLDYDLTVPDGTGTGATVAVLLHGRGSDKRDLQGLVPVFPADWVLVTPQAPFAGAEWNYGPGWAWYRYLDGDRVVTETLDESLSKLGAFLRELPTLLGFEPGRLVLGGFSQGGGVSMAYALAHPGAVVAALNFSGFLAASVELDETGLAPPGTPIFWGHGTNDPNIPISLAEKGRARLRSAGAQLVTRDYGIGHWIVPDEVHDAVAMVEES